VKRPLISIVLVLALAALVATADHLLARVLNRQLPGLLSSALGIPVSLDPVRADILGLAVHTPRLVMGETGDPAILATDVSVGLAWRSLLRGELRLVSAQAYSLLVKPSRWPSSDSPWPEDYHFLEQWLPGDLRVTALRYVGAEGSEYPVESVRWRRQFGGGTTLSWSEQRLAGKFAFAVKLASLDDLLGLAQLQLDTTVTAPAPLKAGSKFTLRLKPADGEGYQLNLDGRLAGSAITLSATSAQAWHWPEQSKIALGQIDTSALGERIEGFDRTKQDMDLETFLASAVPVLDLPTHRSEITLEELRIGDELLSDIGLSLSTAGERVDIIALKASGPVSDIKGAGSVIADAQGWRVDLRAGITASTAGETLAPKYVSSEWLLHSGKLEISGAGNTWGGLLDDLSGEISVDGAHRGATNTPVTLSALLDNKPDAFALDSVKLQLGKSVITGSAALAGGEQRKLQVRFKADQVDLGFLFPEEESGQRKPGLPVPTYLQFLPGVELDVKGSVNGLDTPDVSLRQANLTLKRQPGHGELHLRATGPVGGKLEIDLDGADQADGQLSMRMLIKQSKLDLATMFRQPSIIRNSRVSGTIKLQSEGPDIATIFKAMQGAAQLSLEIRQDGDWNRPATEGESLGIAGNADLVIEENFIRGLEIHELDIEGLQKHLSGTISLVSNRQPWLSAELSSRELNLDSVMEWFPESSNEQDNRGLLDALRDLGALRLTLQIDELHWQDAHLNDFDLSLSSSAERFDVDAVQFTMDRGKLSGDANITWQGELANFSADAKIKDLSLDSFILPPAEGDPIPLTGTLKLQGEGTSIGQIASTLSGHVLLRRSSPIGGLTLAKPAIADRRQVDVKLQRVEDGIIANFGTLIWGDSELTGQVRYHRASPPLWDVEVSGGNLSLLPWEDAAARLEEQKKAAQSAKAPGQIEEIANESAGLVMRLLTTPTRLLTGSGEATTSPSERVFSDETIDFSPLSTQNLTLKGKLDSLVSREGEARDIDFDARLEGGKLRANVKAGYLNGGTLAATVSVDATTEPPTIAIDSEFNGIYRYPDKSGYPRSGYTLLTSQGNTQAELAAHLNGMTYGELGKGPLGVRGMSFLTSDVTTAMFRILIPGSEKIKPELDCAVVLGKFTDGLGITPYGYAARTRRANLIGRMEVNLKKETIQVQFESQSREGAGLSIGNVFSNSVRIQGPLSAPGIVPNTTSLLWRGWAAFMTGGLSVLGESVLKRALVAENPCEDIRKAIRKDVCGSDDPVAHSPLVCPA